MFGPHPADLQAHEDLADRLPGEDAVGPAFFVADGGEQVERPQARLSAEVAGRLVQQGFEVVVSLAGPGGDVPDGCTGPLGEAVQAAVGEVANEVAHRLPGQAIGRADGCGRFALGAGEQALAAAHGERQGGPQADSQMFALGIGQGTDVEGFHKVILRAESNQTTPLDYALRVVY